jgi:hypothetical protein
VRTCMAMATIVEPVRKRAKPPRGEQIIREKADVKDYAVAISKIWWCTSDAAPLLPLNGRAFTRIDFNKRVVLKLKSIRR